MIFLMLPFNGLRETLNAHTYPHYKYHFLKKHICTVLQLFYFYTNRFRVLTHFHVNKLPLVILVGVKKLKIEQVENSISVFLNNINIH